MTPEEIENLIGQPKSETLEYETDVPLPQVMARIIAAFANTKGGILILGIDNDSNIVGLKEDSLAASVTELAISRIAPELNIWHGKISLDQGSETKHLYVVKVEGSSAGYFITENASVYIREEYRTIKKNIQEIYLIPPKHNNEDVIRLSNKIGSLFNGSTESKTKLLYQYLALLILTDTVIEKIREISHFDPQFPSTVQHGRTFKRLIFSSIIDSFEAYLTNILLEILLARPEIIGLNSSNSSTRKILENSEWNTRKRKLRTLNTFEEAFDNTDVKVWQDEEPPKEVKSWFEIRNLFIHQNGIIDKKFLINLKRISSDLELRDENLGHEYKVSFEKIYEIMIFFIEVVCRIDAEAITKHRLSKA